MILPARLVLARAFLRWTLALEIGEQLAAVARA
jgi:hypothetical protein